MKNRGYFSTEAHVHLDWQEAADLATVEDLDFAQSIHHWNDNYLTVSSSLIGQTFSTSTYGLFQGKSTLWDLEKEGEFGSNSLFSWGLEAQYVESGGPGPYLRVMREIRSAGGIVGFWNGSPEKSDVQIGALLGLVDAVNVANNIFHRHFTKDYYGVPEETLISNNYKRLETIWGAGARIAVGAGTAIGVWEDALGYNRTYVYTGGDASIDAFKKGWREGRNFTTNGPMIFLTVNGYVPGDAVAFQSGDTLDITLKAIANWPLRKADIVINGTHIPMAVSPGTDSAVWNYKVPVSVSTYVTAYVTSEDTILTLQEQQKYLNVDGEIARLRWGYTSPFYAILDDLPGQVSSAIQEVKQGINDYESWVGGAGDSSVQQDIDSARSILNNPSSPPVKISDVFVPKSRAFLNVFPNPFNSKTLIKLQTGNMGSVRFLRVYDTQGRMVKDFSKGMGHVNGSAQYQVHWNANDLSSGIYFLRAKIGRGLLTRSLFLIH